MSEEMIEDAWQNWLFNGGPGNYGLLDAFRAGFLAAYNPNERLREALAGAVAALGRVNVRCFDRAESPLKPIGDIARDALAETCRLLGDETYDAIAESALSPLPQGDDT